MAPRAGDGSGGACGAAGGRAGNRRCGRSGRGEHDRLDGRRRRCEPCMFSVIRRANAGVEQDRVRPLAPPDRHEGGEAVLGHEPRHRGATLEVGSGDRGHPTHGRSLGRRHVGHQAVVAVVDQRGDDDLVAMACATAVEEEVALPDRDGLAAERHPVAVKAHADDAAPSRGLLAHQLWPAEALGPERGQHAVRRTGDRILVHPDGRGEEAAHAVDALAVARRGDGDAAGIEHGQGAQVRLQRPDRGGRAELHDEVEAAPADGVDLGRPEGPGERVVVGGRRRGKGREVHLDPAVGFLAAGEHATEGVEGRVAAQHMGRGQGGVAAQGDLGRRREPPQVERPVAPLHEERRLGEVHLRGDVLHPDGVGGTVEPAHGGGVPAEGGVGEGVDDTDGDHRAGTVARRGRGPP